MKDTWMRGVVRSLVLAAWIGGGAAVAQGLESGSPATAQITAPSQTVQHAFSANQGERIHVTLVKVGGDASFEPYARIYAPGQPDPICTLDAGTQAGAGQAAIFTVPATSVGGYTVRVGDWSAQGSGSYQVLIVRAPAGTPVTQQEPDNQDTNLSVLVSGKVITNRIDYAGDIDVIRFAARQGECVHLSLVKVSDDTGGSFEPSAWLYDPAEGSPILALFGGTQAGAGSVTTFVAPYDSSDFTLVVRGYNCGSFRGNYQLVMVRAPAGEPVAQLDLDNPEAGARLVSGSVATNQISYGGDMDVFTFAAYPQDFVHMTLVKLSDQTGANFHPYVYIYDPVLGDGIAVLYGDLPIGQAVTADFHTVSSATNYTVVVHDDNANGRGQYRLALNIDEYPRLPVILTQPADRTVREGEDAVFSVLASGSAPLSYRWRLSGSVLSENSHTAGATGSVLTVHSAVPGDAGPYTVIVSNPAGAVTSEVAHLIVRPAPLPRPLRIYGLSEAGFVALESDGAAHESLDVEGSITLTNWHGSGAMTYSNGVHRLLLPMSNRPPSELFRSLIQ